MDKKEIFILSLINVIGIIIVSGIIIAMLNSRVMAQESSPNSSRNLIYLRIINNVLPVVKTMAFDEEDMAENQFSLKDKALELVGIDLDNPTSILEKGIATFALADNTNNDASKNNRFSLNPFKLNDSDVTKDDVKNQVAQNSGDNKSAGKAATPSSTSTELKIDNKVAQVLNPKLKQVLNPAKPQILIYHSHTCESYAGDGGSNNGTDKSRSVCAVGEAMKKDMEANYGISVIHDTTVHDLEMYNGSYARSRKTVQSYLKKYGDFKIIIDLHRDSVDSRSAVTAKFNNEYMAKFMFVMCRKNPHYAQNISIVNKMQNIADSLYPGLCRGQYYYDYGTLFFNQDLSNNSILIEVGSQVNKPEEAVNTAKYIDRVIAEYLNGKK